MLTPSILFVKL